MTHTTLNHMITNRHGLRMTVLIEVPEVTPNKGMIVLCHGFTSAKDRPTLTLLAHETVQHGLVTLRFDTSHSGADLDAPPELGTITNFLEDLHDVLAWAENQAWYQAPFILVGSSLGGISALEYTRHHPENVKALAPLWTVISGQCSLEAHERVNSDNPWRKTGLKPMANPNRPDGFMYVPWNHMEDRMRYDALAYAPDIRMPILQIVGSEDQSCPPDQQQRLFDALGSQDKELHIIDGAPHTFTEDHHREQLRYHFTNWLKKVV